MNGELQSQLSLLSIVTFFSFLDIWGIPIHPLLEEPHHFDAFKKYEYVKN